MREGEERRRPPISTQNEPAFDWFRHIEFSSMGSRIMGFVGRDPRHVIYEYYIQRMAGRSSSSSSSTVLWLLLRITKLPREPLRDQNSLYTLQQRSIQKPLNRHCCYSSSDSRVAFDTLNRFFTCPRQYQHHWHYITCFNSYTLILQHFPLTFWSTTIFQKNSLQTFARFVSRDAVVSGRQVLKFFFKTWR